MRIAVFIFSLTAFLSLSFNSFSQNPKISLNARNLSIKDALREIENSSPYYFLYNNDLLDVEQKINIAVTDESIENVINALFVGQEISFTVKNRQIIIFPKDFEKEKSIDKTISGKVEDEGGFPLVGVAVVIRGTTQGTITDENGNFSIVTKARNIILDFSYIGMMPQSVAYSGGVMRVVLRESKEEIDEVIIVAYGIQSKSSLTGSIQSVNDEKLNRTTRPNIATMMQSLIPGLMVSSSSGAPGVKPQLRIRGDGSLNYTNEPLWVVDGVIYGNSSPDINTNDIESVSVLKDAAAAALFGSRASNGVILIKTKEGLKNSSSFKFSSNTGITRLSQGPFSLMNGQELYDYVAPMVGNSFDALYKKYWDEATAWWGTNQSWWVERNMGTTDKETYLRKSLPAADSDQVKHGTDWQKLAFKNGYIHDYNLSFQGGIEKTTVFASLGYFNEDGAVVGKNWEKFSARLNLDYNATDRIKLSVKLGGIFQDNFDNENGMLYGSYILLPWDNPYFDDGSVKVGRTEVDGLTWYGRDQWNPLYSRQFNYNKSRNQQYASDLGVEFKLTNWLVFTTTNHFMTTTTRAESIVDARSPGGQADNGLITNTYTYGSNVSTSNLLRFSYKSNRHYVFGIAGQEYLKSYYDDLSAEGKGIYPTLEIIGATSKPKDVDGTKTESAFFSLLSNVQYIYNDKYTAQLSFRRDGSSRFGENQRYGNFYSLGAMWAISKERFMKSVDFVDNLKLRASYGLVGNANISDFVALGLYNMTVQYDGEPGGFPRRLSNPDLTWESNVNSNIAIDAGLFSRLKLTVDFYNKKTKNLLQDVPMPMVTGYYWMTANIGSIQNTGVELLVNADILKSHDFNWKIDFNLSFNKNKVLKLSRNQDIISGNKIIREGWDMNTWFLRKWSGVDPANGDPLWEQLVTENSGVQSAHKTNSYNSATLQSVGSSSPSFFGGFSHTVSYRGFSLISNFNFVSGNKIYNSSRELFDNDGAYPKYNAMRLQKGWSRWENAGDVATHPKPVLLGNKLSNKPSSRYLEDGSFIRLRYVSLNYSVPPRFARRLGLHGAVVKVSGENLWTLTRFSGMDPEAGVNGDAGTIYPVTRKYILGLDINF